MTQPTHRAAYPSAWRRPPEPLSEPDWRTPGCSTPQCRRGSHNPAIHEAFGRLRALEQLAARDAEPTGIVRTGPIAVDFDVLRVTVRGRDAGLSVNELRVMFYLTSRLGKTCRHVDVTRSIWGDEAAELSGRADPGHGSWHLVRVNVARARRKLGSAGGLIETVTGFGYRLVVASPEGGSDGPD